MGLLRDYIANKNAKERLEQQAQIQGLQAVLNNPDTYKQGMEDFALDKLFNVAKVKGPEREMFEFLLKPVIKAKGALFNRRKPDAQPTAQPQQQGPSGDQPQADPRFSLGKQAGMPGPGDRMYSPEEQQARKLAFERQSEQQKAAIQLQTKKAEIAEADASYKAQIQWRLGKVAEINKSGGSADEKLENLSVLGVNMPHMAAVGDIPGAAVKGQVDAFGHPTNEKGTYKLEDGKLYPQQKDSVAKTDQDIALAAYAQTHGKDISALSPAEQMRALQEFKESPDVKSQRELTRELTAQRLKDLKEIDDDAKAIASGIMNGMDPPDLAGLGRTGMAGKVRAALDSAGYDLAGAQKDWLATKRHLATLNGPQQTRMVQALDSLDGVLPKVEDAYRRWKATGLPSGFKVFNKQALSASANLPGEKGAAAQNLMALINDAIIPESAVIVQGGNTPTEESLKIARQNIQSDWNEQQFEDAIKRLGAISQIRRNSILSSETVGLRPNSPYRLGKDAGGNSAGAPATVNMKAPDGTVKPVPADQVEHYKSLGATVVK